MLVSVATTPSVPGFDHALGTAEGGPAVPLRLPAVLDELGQAGGGRVMPVVAVWQLGTDALQG
eukprot:scaffold28670_cov66-Phaeocystis_antarctica.AAC.1